MALVELAHFANIPIISVRNLNLPQGPQELPITV